MRTTAESGDGIVRFRGRLPKDNFRVPLQLQVLEGDYLDLSRTTGIATELVVDGTYYTVYEVSVDPTGAARLRLRQHA